MSDWLFLAVYALAALVTGRLLYAYAFDKDIYQIGALTLFGLMLIWPVLAAIAAVFVVAGGVVWLVTWENPFRRESDR